jgi:hypothetical protein
VTATPNAAQPSPSADSTQAQEPPRSSFPIQIHRFVHDVESLETTLPSLMRFLTSFAAKQRKSVETFLDLHATHKIEGGRHVPPNALPTLMRLRRRAARGARVKWLVPRSFIVTLISQYDAYLGRLIRLIYLTKPDLLSASDRNITFAQLLAFGSLEEASERIVEKEVESVLRQSHPDQFAWIERKLGIPLTKGLAAWPSFIELTERRNLYVHCNGIVSTQYLNVCREHLVKLAPSCQLGKPLNITGTYFEDACATVLNVGIKLGHVLWLKLVPDERDYNEGYINIVCLELISRGRFELARDLLEFALNTLLRSHSSASRRWKLIVNLAQSYKWGGNEDKCREIIQSHDWSPLGYMFRLAAAVLLEDYEKAIEFMRKIGPEGEVSKLDYQEWPLFNKLRHRDEFMATFKEIFGEPFNRDAISERRDDLSEGVPPQGTSPAAPPV